MTRVLKWLGLALAGVLLAAAALAAHTWYAKPLSIDWFYARVFAQFALDNPEVLTQIRLLESIGIRGHNARFGDASPAQEDRQLAQFKTAAETLQRYDRNDYRGPARLSYDILQTFLSTQVRGEPWRYHNFPVNQLFGVQSQLPNLMTQTQQVNDATDAEHYLARLDAFPKKFAQVIESVNFRAARGVIPPRFVVEKVSDQIRGFIAPGAATNPLVTTFREKLAKIPADKMDAAAREAFVRRAEASVARNVLPAYQRLQEAIDALRPRATRNDGAWSLPEGDKYYQYMIEQMTTTTMKAEEIHALGLSEVARIGAEMDRILTAEGFPQGTRQERIRAVTQLPAQRYPNTDVGRQQVLKDYQAIIDDIDAGLGPAFATRPQAKVEVKRVPTFTEKTAPGAYYQPPALDGSKPGTFFANLRDLDNIPRFGMRTLAYHEAIPGHHLQIAIAQELRGLPLFRRLLPFTAYSEGWALYAEQLAWEMGFQNNPLDNLGRLQAEMFRAVRLVVDTGIHAKRWTREQAIDYMTTHTGMAEAEVVAEIERYFVMPAQALAYKVGMMKMLALRERAKTALGARFDIRRFHDAVLKNGAMPLSVLESVIDGYITQESAAAAQ